MFLPGKSHGQRSLVGYHPRGCKESDMTERLHSHPWGIGYQAPWMLKSGWGNMVSFFVFMIGSDLFRKCLSVWCEERSKFYIFHLIIFTWMLDYPVLHIYIYIKFVVVVQSPGHIQLFATPQRQQARPPCPSPSLKVCPSSCLLHW